MNLISVKSKKVLELFAIGLFFPILISLIANHLFEDWRMIDEPLHSVVEVIGSFIAFSILFLIYLARRGLTSRGADTTWTINALLSMGILDLFHSIVETGNAFVWLHSTATFFGGLVFALVWLPRKISFKLKNSGKYFAIFMFAFGISSVLFAEHLPPMIIDGSFSFFARFLNIFGGLGYIGAFLYFCKNYLKRKEKDDYLLSAHCLLFGSAGALFELSVLWDAGWWWWHFLRLAAYAILGFFFYSWVSANNQVQRLAKIVENSEDGIITIDIDGFITDWNKGAEKIFQYSAEELIAKSIKTLLQDDDIHAFSKILNRVQKGRSISNYQMTLQAKNKKQLEVSMSISPLLEEHSLVNGLALIVRDISDRKEKEIIKQRTLELEASNKELEDFAYVASHDLREPLRKVVAFGDRLHELYFDNLDDIAKDYLTRMQNASLRMEMLLDNLLEYSRVSRREIDYKQHELKTILLNSLSDLEDKILKSKADIYLCFNDAKINLYSNGIFNTSSSIPEIGSIEVDDSKLERVLINLFSNALKYQDKLSEPVVDILINYSSDKLSISIQDNGIGFDMSYKEKIFQQFSRLHSRFEYEGTGMGLSTVKRILDRFGATVEVSSLQGKGSVFTIKLNTKNRNLANANL